VGVGVSGTSTDGRYPADSVTTYVAVKRHHADSRLKPDPRRGRSLARGAQSRALRSM
jgi:hypothetical protein